MFVAGILKCVLKPWQLKRASINSLVDSSAGLEKIRNVSSLDEYIQAATENFREGHGGQQSGPDQPQDNSVWKWWEPNDLFVDLPFPYSARLFCLKAMLYEPDRVDGLVRSVLSVTFDRLYTKTFGQFINPEGIFNVSSWLRAFVTILAAAMASAIVRDHTEGYDRTDVKITLILLCLVLALDYILPILMIGELDIRKVSWPDQVAQYNLIGYIVRNKKHRKLRRLATLLVCKDYIDQLWCMKPSKSSSDITKVVHGYIAKGWTEHHIKDMATYRAFNDNRGQWTLNREGCGDNLGWSLERPFDESVLLWHLATDI